MSWDGAVRLAGRYLTFKLADLLCGVAVRQVRELIGPLQIARVGSAAPWIRGVIHLRACVIPVVDLRLKLELGETPATPLTAIIVVAGGDKALQIGVLVDEVLEVRHFEPAQIAPPAPPASSAMGAVTVGVGTSDRCAIWLVDLARAVGEVA